jgi:polar amino acid transport system substrate-binding protein
VEIEGSSIVGVLPQEGFNEELGFLFEDASPLVPCVNEALATLTEDGTLEALQEEWLNQGGDIPTLEP